MPRHDLYAILLESPLALLHARFLLFLSFPFKSANFAAISEANIIALSVGYLGFLPFPNKHLECLASSKSNSNTTYVVIALLS
jgi:hypothetical protein